MSADHVLPEKGAPGTIHLRNSERQLKLDGLSRYVYRDERLDVAILEAPELRGTVSMTIDRSPLKLGQKLDRVIFSPHEGRPIVFEAEFAGMFAPYSDYPRGLPVTDEDMFFCLQEGIDATTPINRSRHGYSGSPVISEIGVVGLTTRGRVKDAQLYPPTAVSLKNATENHTIERAMFERFPRELWLKVFEDLLGSEAERWYE